MSYNLTDPYEIARFIKESKKSTPVKVYVNGDLSNAEMNDVEWYGSNGFYILMGESDSITKIVLDNKHLIKHFRMIHLILAIMSGYLLAKTNNILGFFNEYLNNNETLIGTGTVSEYFNNTMILFILMKNIVYLVLI